VNAGGYMSCGVQSDQSAACWGDNINEGPGQATPPAGLTFREVNSGYSTACGVLTDQTLTCWGSSIAGGNSPPSGIFTHVAPGFNFGCGLRTPEGTETAGTAACWGADGSGQVSNVPSGTFTQLTVGIRHACGLRADGTITCWGSNTYGQLNVPPGTYQAVNSGNFTPCAIRTDGTVVCWGRDNGQQVTLAALQSGTFTQVSSGFAHVCGLRSNGTITCWGRNSEGQNDAPAGTFNNVSAGTFHSCAMPTSGQQATCWGGNAAGRSQPNLSAADPPDATVGSPYEFQFAMTTHVAPAPTFSVTGSLPPGLEFSPDGQLSGTPTAPGGTYGFTVAASNGLSPATCLAPTTGSLACTPGDRNSVATATRNFEITITASPTTTTTLLPPIVLPTSTTILP
jgi:hypothetical protein